MAVLSVVAYHAFPGWMKGGFIGVDVFFVISGYLISTIIFQNLDNGTFGLCEFYARRIRRIFPALLIVLVSSYIFGWFALLADEYKHLGKHIVGGAGFVSNIVLWNEAGYFETSSETTPLLHLWSLGIEEQFYILWPLLLCIAWKRNLSLFTITIGFAIVSFYLNVSGVSNNAVATFYSPQTRFWELLCGSLLAWVMLYKKDVLTPVEVKLDGWLSSATHPEKPGSNRRLLSNFLSFFGLALLLYGVWRINKQWSFPGKLALVPVLGAVLIIWAGPEALVNRVIFSNRVAVWFGLISFPLYLWHWPLLSFSRIVESKVPDLSIRMVVVNLAVVLAWLTYRLVERPLRIGKHSKNVVFILSVLMALSAFIGYETFRKDGLRFRPPVKVIEQMLEDKILPVGTRGSDGSCEKLLDLNTVEGSACLANSEKPDVLIVGDSHAMALNSAAYVGKVGVKTLLIGAHGCVPLVGYAVVKDGVHREACDALVKQVADAILRYGSIRTVVLATRGPYYFTGEGFGVEGKSRYAIVPSGGKAGTQSEMFRDGYSDFVSKLTLMKKEVVFVIDEPELGENPAGCFVERPLTLSKKAISSCSQGKDKVLYRQEVYREMVKEIKEANHSLMVYDTLPVFCDDATCYGVRDRRLYYFDDDHMSIAASEAVLNDLLSKGMLK